jgi:hypothetical protein
MEALPLSAPLLLEHLLDTLNFSKRPYLPATPMPAHPPNQQASALEEVRKLKGSYKLGYGKPPVIVKSISYIPSTQCYLHSHLNTRNHHT